MDAYVKSTIEYGIGTIEFFHPQSNSMSKNQLMNLTNEIEKLGNDKTVKVIILKSSGERAFCAGASFDELISIKDRKTGLDFFSGFAHVINAIRLVPKFVIARIQGKVVGGGVGIAAAADYTFATEFAAVKLSELTIGIGPFVVGPSVERKIGVSAFMQMTIHATEFYTAQWAKEKGLFTEIYSTIDEIDFAINSLANKLISYNPDAMKHMKRVFWEGTENWNELLLERAKISGELVLSNFTINAINQFKTK